MSPQKTTDCDRLGAFLDLPFPSLLTSFLKFLLRNALGLGLSNGDKSKTRFCANFEGLSFTFFAGNPVLPIKRKRMLAYKIWGEGIGEPNTRFFIRNISAPRSPNAFLDLIVWFIKTYEG